MARAELKAIQGQQAIAEYGVSVLSNVAAELTGSNEDVVFLRDVASEFEVDRLPERGARIKRIADRLQMIEAVGDKPNRVMLSALVALGSLRLAELQSASTANAERIAQLEAFLKQADSRVVVPNLQV